MTNDEMMRWLEAHRPVPPPALAARLRAAAGGAAPAGPEQLAALGLAVLRAVAARPAGGRELALDLLAADALVTYAFEAQAVSDVGGLAPLADYVVREGGEGA